MSTSNTPSFGNCHYCQQDKLDCLPDVVGPVCASCRWVRRPAAEPRVYDRKVGQRESCRVVVELCHPNAKLPDRKREDDACFDLYATEDIRLINGCTYTIRLGVKLQLEQGWEAQIRGRSSLQSKGLLVTVGTVDEGYRKEIAVIITCQLPQEGFTYKINAGDRIAQMAVRRVPQVELVAGTVEPSERGGFGSTGR